MTRSIRTALVSAFAGILVTGASAAAFASDWEVDPSHSLVGFSVKHMVVTTVHGKFDKYVGTASIDDSDLAKARAHIEIDASSIDTGDAKRDDHLRSADFFDVARFPKLTFDTTHVEKRPDGYSLAGNLTIKNVTRPVTLTVVGLNTEVKDPWGGIRRGGTASTKINRKDFGLTWNKALEAGGVVVGDEITLELEIELKKK